MVVLQNHQTLSLFIIDNDNGFLYRKGIMCIFSFTVIAVSHIVISVGVWANI